MKQKKFVAVLLALLCSAVLYGQKVDLVKNGKVVCEIVIGDKPSLDAQFGAWELQYHIRLITGQTVPIRKASEKRTMPTALVVGESTLARKLGFKKEDYKDENYELKFLPGYIVMAGSEEKSRVKLDVTHFQKLPRTFLLDHGALWAVYEFLERCCDVRWYGPCEVGVTYTPRKTLSVKKVHVKRAPSMDCFRSLNMGKSKTLYGSLVPVSKEDMVIFMLRWRQTYRYGSANHNLHSIYLAHWDKSPVPKHRAKQKFLGQRKDFFAQGYEGQADRHLNGARKYFPNDPDVPPQLCKTHPGVFEYFGKEAVNARKGIFAYGASVLWLPLTRTYNVPFYYHVEDEDNHAICKCARCSKAFTDKGYKRPSYIHFNWAANIAREAAKRDPKTNVSTLAYGLHQHYPHGLDMPSNLGVQMVLHCANYFHKAYRDREMKIFYDWTNDSVKGKRLITIWTHYLAPCWDAKNVYRYNNYFPVFFYREIGKFLKLCVERKVRGYYSENPLEIGYPLAYTRLELYMTMMMAFDGSKDVDTLVDEYFPRYYGKAGKPMKKFYETIRLASQDLKNYPAKYSDPNSFADGRITHSFFPEEVNWGCLGTKERMAQLEKYVREASRLVKTPMEKLRFKLFLNNLWEPMKKGRSAFEQKLRFMARPVPALTATKVAPANGDVSKVNWNKAAKSASFRTLQGFPGAGMRVMSLAHDGKYLYIQYTENGETKNLISTKKIWNGDDVEILFAAKPQRPYMQFAISPANKTFAMGYFATADATYTAKWDFKAKSKVITTPDKLVIRMAFPLDRVLPNQILKGGMTFYMNVFRASPDKAHHGWSPTFTRGFHEVSRMGKITLAK